MNVLWLLFELIVNVYQGFIAMYFVYAYLKDKKSRSFFNNHGMIFAIIYATAVTILNIATTIFEHFYALIYIIIVFVYSAVSLKGSLMRKIFASAFSVGIQLASTAFIGILSTIIFGKDLALIFTISGVPRFISIIAVQLMILYVTFISLKLLSKSTKGNQELTLIEWILILTVLTISIVMGTMLVISSVSIYDINFSIYTVLILIGIIVVNIVVCYLVIDLGKKNEIAREVETLRLAQEYNQQYVNSATAEYDTIRKLQHDFKNNYYTVHTLIKEGNAQAALDHIEGNLELLESFAVFVKSENPIVNAVVNAKFSEAKTFGIDCSCICGTDFKHIDNLDLCRLLSNLLENAVTACKQSRSEHPSIVLSLLSDESTYSIDLKNTIDTSVLESNPQLLTTKKNRNDHGYGINIIKEIASKYDGYCDFYEESGMFCCRIILNSTKNKADCE